MISNAVLGNAEHPEYGVVTIPLPIPREEFDHVMEMLDVLEIGSPTGRDCTLHEIDGWPQVLKRLEGTRINVDELDYLFKRLDSFDYYEAAQFQGMVHKLNLTDMTDLINLTFCCQAATVIMDFSDLEQIGKQHYFILKGGCCPTKELQTLDGKEVALQLLAQNDVAVTPYGVVYDNGMRLEQLYDGVHFPAYLYERSALVAEVPSEPAGGFDVESTWFFLPLPETQIDRLMKRSGITQDCRCQLSNEYLPENLMAVAEHSSCDLHTLNRLCEAVMSLKDGELVKLAAVTEMARPEDVDEALELVKNLDLFDFTPNVTDAESYGRYMIQESGHFEYDPNLEDFYDYEGYGHQRIAEENGLFIKQGYVCYQGSMSLEELMLGDPAEKVQTEQDFQMGGMT